MTINKFIKEWAPTEPHLKTMFTQDLWLVIDKLGDDRFRQVAIEVLGDISGSELKMCDFEHANGYVDGRIVWGKKGNPEETGIVVSYAKAVGQQGGDWLYLLKCVAQKAISE